MQNVLRRKKGILGGVATGIADYFGLDVSMVRLAFILTAMGGAGFFFYIALWVAIPKEGWEFSGEPVPVAA